MSRPIATGGDPADRGMALSDVLGFLKRATPLAVTVMLIAGATAAIITRGMAPTYRASSSLVVSQAPLNVGNLELLTPPRVDPSVYQAAIMRGPVLANVLSRVEGASPSEASLEQFKRKLRITIDSQLNSSVLNVEVVDEIPERAATFANEITTELIAWDRERARGFLESAIGAIERSIEQLDAQLVETTQESDQTEVLSQQALLATLRAQRVRELEAARASTASAVVVGSLSPLAVAKVPETAVGPRLVFNTFIALVLGLAVGYGGQLLRWSARDAVTDSDRLAAATGIPVLASFPRIRKPQGRSSGEAGSFLRANLLRRLGASKENIIGVTSSVDNDEKARVAISLAERMAVSGYKVLLIDGDLRGSGPGLGIDSSSSNVPGTEDYLSSEDIPFHPIRVLINQKASFDVVPSYTPTNHASETLEAGLPRLLREVTEVYDMVIFDLPPVLRYADAVTVAQFCTGVIVCAGVDSGRKVVSDAIDMLQRSGATVVGTVLTGTRSQKFMGSGVSSNHSRSDSARRTVGAESASRKTKRVPSAMARVRQR